MTLQAVKGTRDILPEDIGIWQEIEAKARSLFKKYGYREIRTPLFEATEVFARGIGTETDIVSKEMYTFQDRGGESLTLRPEATAGIVRSVIQHNLIQTDPLVKVYLIGPMFRAEQPQAGRYRQFHQVDVEVFGLEEPGIDAEVVELAVRYLERCGLADYEVVLNSVGDAKCRPAYVEQLREALRANLGRLGADSRRRTETNPLRVLDSKVPEEQELIAALPKIGDALCPECRDHFDEVRRQLDLLGIRYRLEPRLVRGLDYYVRTTFEVTSSGLGRTQNSVLGGGRYDGLVELLGGGDVSGIGFALGMERLAMLLSQQQGLAPAKKAKRCDIYIASLLNAPEAKKLVIDLQKNLREAIEKDLPGEDFSVLRATEPRSLKAQLKRADKLGARLVAILGDDELAKRSWSVRDMKASSQDPVAAERVVDYLKEKLANG